MIDIHPRTREAYNLFHKGIQAFARAEQQGFRVDLEYIQRKKAHIVRRIERFEQKFKESDFFKEWQKSIKKPVNINSHKELKDFLYKVKGLHPPKSTASGSGSTDEEAIKQLNIPDLNLLLEKTRFKKPLDVLSGFEREQVDGYVHPFYNLHLVTSYRSSSSDPNFQNIPVRDEEVMQLCRGALYPRPGHQLVEIDFKAIEVGVNACYNKDTNLVKYVSDPKTDMHGDMAKQLFMLDNFDKKIPAHDILRKAAKNSFVFPQFYGDYWKDCAENLVCNWGKLPKGKWSRGQGIEIDTSAYTLSDHLISKGFSDLGKVTRLASGKYEVTGFYKHVKDIEQDFWENRFPEYAEWKDRWWSVYQKYGYFDLLTGFRCNGVMDKKQATNLPAQGSAFHCNLWTFNRLDEIMVAEKWDTKLIGQIHDSIILDVNPDELKYIAELSHNISTKQLPAAWKWIIVPLESEMELCEVDQPWSEKKKFKL
jgi:DNA polymerase I-like protein with 3'-5' exonuclease and polymerase domains